FGKAVKLQEAENQIVTAYEVYDRRPSDCDLLIGAIDIHQARLGRVPRLVAADAAFYSANNERAAKAKGVKRVCIPKANPAGGCPAGCCNVRQDDCRRNSTIGTLSPIELAAEMVAAFVSNNSVPTSEVPL